MSLNLANKLYRWPLMSPLLPCLDNLLAWNVMNKYYERSDNVYCLDDKMGKRIDVPRQGQCYQFDGLAYVDLNSQPANGQDYLKITHQIKRVPGSAIGVINSDDVVASRLGYIWFSDNRIYFFVGDGSSLNIVNTDIISDCDNVKCDVISVYDGTLPIGDRIKITVNGVDRDIISTTGTIGPTYQGTPAGNYITGKYETSSFYTGKGGEITIENRTDIDHIYHCNEELATTAFDSKGTANGTILNHTPATFFATDNDFANKANDEGYTDNAGQIVPIRPDGLDALGGIPTNPGRVKRGIEVLTTETGDGKTDPTGIDPSLLFYRYPDIPSFQVWDKLDTLVWGSNFAGTPDADKFTWTAAELLNIPQTLEDTYQTWLFVKTAMAGPLTAVLTTTGQSGDCLAKTDRYVKNVVMRYDDYTPIRDENNNVMTY